MWRACCCGLLLLIAACTSPQNAPEKTADEPPSEQSVRASRAAAAQAETGQLERAQAAYTRDAQRAQPSTPPAAQQGQTVPREEKPTVPAEVPAPVPPAAPPPAAPALQDEPFVSTPQDLQVDVTVLVGRNMPESLKVEDRQSRYVLFPDGALHAETGPLLTQASRPGRARWLYQQQVSDFWSMCNQTGFADMSLANGPANPDMIHASTGERVTIICMSADGKRWSFVRRSLGDAPTDPAAAKLVRTLAALAWIPDFSARDVAPERYDYGPDPYAEYRKIPPAGRGQ